MFSYLLLHKKKNASKVSRATIISIGTIACVFGLIGFFILNSFIPVNSDGFVFMPPTNIFLKAVKSPQGYHYSSQSTKGGKIAPTTRGDSPQLMITSGNLIQIHLINEEKNESGINSKHNLNIDEFNVHTRDLGYFQTESITFLADKTGTFDYYCSIHPEMRGIMVIK